MSTKKIFQMVGMIGFVALGSASSCLAMEAKSEFSMEVERRSPSDEEDVTDQFSSMSISSSGEDLCDFDSIARVTKVLGFQLDFYTKIENTKKQLRFGEAESTKNMLLNDLDQGLLIFGIIKHLVEAEHWLNDLISTIEQFNNIASKRSLTVTESAARQDCTNARIKLIPLVEIHKPLLVSAIEKFDKTAKLRLFWLLVHLYCPIMKKISQPIVSENTYSNKRHKWLKLAHEGLNKISAPHVKAIEATLSTLLPLPSNNNFYLLLEMAPQN